jgi:ribonuclease HI
MKKRLPPIREEEIVEEEIQVKSAQTLMQKLGVPSSKWHMLAVTDGSGCKIERPIGYASVIFQRQPSQIKYLMGSASFGGVNEAETRAVFDVVSYAMRTRPPHFEHGFYVHIVTDSEYVRKCLAEMDPIKVYERRSHPHLWQGIAQARRRGIMIVPHYIPRNTYVPMVTADTLSKLARKSIEGAYDLVAVNVAMRNVDENFPIK